MPKKGEILRTTFENFEIVSQINSGGAGEVYLAKTALGESVAIKVLRSDPDSTKRKRFEREIRFCSQEVHPNIVRILGHGIHVDGSGERPFYAMPLYDGTLENYLERDRTDEEKLRLFVKVLDGVEAAHKMGITHRDIKAKNILVKDDGSSVVVADFGIARFVAEQMQHEAALSRPGDRLANFEYAAPEQLIPGQEVNESSDIFALGLLLYRIFTGIVPRGANPQQISSVTSNYPFLDEIANAMIQHDRANRPRTIADIKRMLIQRGQEFVTQQKLDELKKRVIPTSELSDPLIDNPIRVEGFDWKNGELILELSQAPNPRWIMTLRNLRSFGGVGNTEPSTVSIQGTEARIPAPERVAEITYNYVRQWISRTNDDYATEQKRMLRENEERERRELQAAVQRAEESKAERARVLERLTRQSR
jgi:serine/threonine protein kinase